MNATTNKKRAGNGWGTSVLAVAIMAVGVSAALSVAYWPTPLQAEERDGCFCPTGTNVLQLDPPDGPLSCRKTDSNPRGQCFASQEEADGSGPALDPEGPAYAAGSKPATAVPDFECHLDPLRFKLENCVAAILNNVVLAPAGLFVGLAGVFLDSVINATIIGFSDFVQIGGAEQGALTLAWSLIRDVLNMVFIFLLLWIGIGTILGSDKVNYQKMIPKIVIAGLLINFSFFFTSVLIDISNVITVQFYDAIISIGEASRSAAVGTVPTLNGLSAAFMNGLQLRPPSDFGGRGVNMIFQLIPAIIAFLVAAFVFLVMGVMLLVRFIVLIVLLITSPVAVVGGLLPQLDSKKWWVPFTAQLTFPPLFMLFELIVVLIINSAGFRKSISVANVAPGTSTINTILDFLLPYALAIGLMITGLIVAKQFAGAAGKGFTDWASKKAGSATFGVAAWGARQGIGRAGGAIAQSSLVGKGLKSDNLLFKYGAKATALTGKKATEATFDVRGTALGGMIPGAGKGRTGGLVGDIKARAERKAKRGEIYAKPIAIQNQRDAVAKNKDLLAKAQEDLAGASSIGGTRQQVADRIEEKKNAVEKARSGVATAENALKELEGGGFGANEARKALQKATEQLTAQQIEEAKAIAATIEAQERRVKTLKDAADYDRKDTQKRAAYNLERRRLDEFKRRQYDERERRHGPALMAYVEAQKAVAAAQKSAKDAYDAAKHAYGTQMVGSRFESTRMAADELRKQSKKSDQAILDELKKVMETVEQGAPGTPPAGAGPQGGASAGTQGGPQAGAQTGSQQGGAPPGGTPTP